MKLSIKLIPQFTHKAPEGYSYEVGLTYLDRIRKECPEALEKIELVKLNDQYGGPLVFSYSTIGEIAPSTLGYLYNGQKMLNYFGSLEGKTIVEIGGGYGGQCLILSKLTNFAQYTIYDLPEANMLTNKYLSLNKTPNFKNCELNKEAPPSHIDLVGAEIELVEMPQREQILKGSLMALKDKYDYIVIDCPPSLGLLTLNSLTAADSVLIPVQCEFYALEGLGQLLNTISIVRRTTNPDLEIEGVLLTMYDSRLRLSNQVVDEVRRHFEDKACSTVISRNVRLSEAPSHGKPVLLYDASSIGAQNYLALATEILAKNNASLAVA